MPLRNATIQLPRFAVVGSRTSRASYSGFLQRRRSPDTLTSWKLAIGRASQAQRRLYAAPAEQTTQGVVRQVHKCAGFVVEDIN